MWFASIEDHRGKIVRGTVEETLNAMLDAEAKRLCNARYERTDARRDTRAVSYERKLHNRAGEVSLKMPKLRQQTFETAIIGALPAARELDRGGADRDARWQRLPRRTLAPHPHQQSSRAGDSRDPAAYPVWSAPSPMASPPLAAARFAPHRRHPLVDPTLPRHDLATPAPTDRLIPPTGHHLDAQCAKDS